MEPMKIKKITKKQVQMVLPALFALVLIGIFVNRNIQIRGLYGDDLYLWSYYGEDNFWNFTFPKETKGNFRPFYWAMSYLEFFIIGRHVNYYAAFNTVVNIAISFAVYFFGLRLTKAEEKNGIFCIMSCLTSFLAAGMYLGSHFASYQIGQVLGLLESLALVLAVLVLWMLYEYTESGKNIMYYAASALFFLVIFTHERYIALFPLFYLVNLIDLFRCKFQNTRHSAKDVYQSVSEFNIQNEESEFRHSKMSRRRVRKGRDVRKSERINSGFWKKLTIPALELLFFFFIRLRIAGQAMPAGTAGTEVTETFDLMQALTYAVMQVEYLFGINAGETYLNGLTWSEAPVWIHVCVYTSLFVMVLMLLFYVSAIKKQGIDAVIIGQNLLFISFIALCIGCSSITVRLEIRWIYVSYTAALLYICYMSGKIGDLVRYKGIAFGFTLLFILYCGLMIPVEQHYRSNFKNIFFWFELDRVNSLADETIGKYKDFLGVRQTYIFYNQYGMTDFYAEYFYKPYDPMKTGQGSEVHFINDVSELPQDADYNNSVVLMESSDRRGYIDITDQVFGKADWDAITQKG